MVVVGRVEGTFVPARLIVAIAQANSASASTKTIAPSQAAGTTAGMNGKGISQLSRSPASTATTHMIGGRTLTFAVSAVSAMAGVPKSAPPSMWASLRGSAMGVDQHLSGTGERQRRSVVPAGLAARIGAFHQQHQRIRQRIGALRLGGFRQRAQAALELAFVERDHAPGRMSGVAQLRSDIDERTATITFARHPRLQFLEQA